MDGSVHDVMSVRQSLFVEKSFHVNEASHAECNVVVISRDGWRLSFYPAEGATEGERSQNT